MPRRVLALLLVLCTVFAGGPAPVVAPPVAAAQAAADAPMLNLVRGAYDLLLDLFYKPVEPRALVNGGWSALSQRLKDAGQSAPPALANVPADREGAFAALTTAYTAYVAQLPSGVTPTMVAYTIADGMASSLNEGHTVFLSPSQYRSFLSDLNGGELPVGLGVSLGGEGGRVITRVAPNGPADQAGAKAGDVIVAANGRSVEGVSASAFRRAIGGQAGQTLTLTVDRGGPRADLAITRGPYYFPPLESRVLTGNVGYMRLDRFVSTGSPMPDGKEFLADLDQQLDALDAAGITGLVLDLRDNGGGSTMAAAELLGRFIPEDVRTVRNFDERGHVAYEVVSGQMRARQVPMALLVNGGSYSSSETTASTMKEAKRAVLVGQKTGGDLATALILPLPEGAGMEIAVAGVVSGQQGTQIDTVGVPVDVTAADRRTAADYRGGRDPQLDAAVAALANAPAPPAFASTPTGMTVPQLNAMLDTAFPSAEGIPTNERLTRVQVTGNLDLTHPNEWVDAGGGARDPNALAQTLRSRGYLGTNVRIYGIGPGETPSVGVSYDLYQTAAGASQSLTTNDFPDMQETIPNPVTLGEGTLTYRGTWTSLGSSSLTWQRGRVLLSASYSDVPGKERPDAAAALAQLVDQAYQQHPLSAEALDAAMAAAGFHPIPGESRVAAAGLRVQIAAPRLPATE